MPYRTADDRFWSKVDVSGVCWEWLGKPDRHGYGRFAVTHYRIVPAHRWSFLLLTGELPVGLTLDHLCRNRMCVDPDHVEPVPNRVNILRGGSPAAINARKTHCPRGHPYDLHYGYERRCKKCELRS